MAINFDITWYIFKKHREVYRVRKFPNQPPTNYFFISGRIGPFLGVLNLKKKPFYLLFRFAVTRHQTHETSFPSTYFELILLFISAAVMGRSRAKNLSSMVGLGLLELELLSLDWNYREGLVYNYSLYVVTI